MKRLLFTFHRFDLGGVEKAFLGMLPQLKRLGYEVHMAFWMPEGPLYDQIPAWVHRHTVTPLYERRALLMSPLRQTLRDVSRGRLGAIADFAAFVRSKIRGTKDIITDRLMRGTFLPDIEFDLAVSYASPHEYLDRVIARHVRARKRAAWIHFDVTRCYASRRSFLSNHTAMDRIFLVSEAARTAYCSMVPELAPRTAVIHNIIDPDAIRRQAALPSAFRPSADGATDIVTVGRISPEKGQAAAIAGFARAVRQGLNARYHLIGDGADTDRCRALAAELGVADRVIFYGARSNPYPFMAGAGIYLQPSVHEGWCITLTEAKLFSAPIVATDFSGAREQLEGLRPNHVICPDHTPQTIATALHRASTLPPATPQSPTAPNLQPLIELIGP